MIRRLVVGWAILAAIVVYALLLAVGSVCARLRRSRHLEVAR